MRTDMIVLLEPFSDDYFGLIDRQEPLRIENFPAGQGAAFIHLLTAYVS